MLKKIKAVLAPSKASWGVHKYWRGQYEDACKCLNRANNWNPQVFEQSVFEGYLGLALYRTGNIEDGIERIRAAQKYLDKVAIHNKDIRQLEKDLLKEMRCVLDDNAI